MSEEIVKLKSPVTDQDHVAGPARAAITLVEYGNFECIHRSIIIASPAVFSDQSPLAHRTRNHDCEVSRIQKV